MNSNGYTLGTLSLTLYTNNIVTDDKMKVFKEIITPFDAFERNKRNYSSLT